MTRRRVILALLVAACVAQASIQAHACSIPVFRYALERWPPDPYEVVVVHRGALAEADQQLVEKIRATAEDETRPANLHVVTVDLDQVPEEDKQSEALKSLIERYADLKTPQLLVHFPAYGPNRWEAWSGPLTAENAQSLIDSPLRLEIVKRLLAGDSAVWVLIESGDKEKDAAAEEILRRELAEMEKAIELPPQEILQAEVEYQDGTPIELRIGFTLVKLQRDDPKEKAFLSMLLNSESDLAEFSEPIAVPIFGRGRTFFALVGKGVNAENIADSCFFICGACSCQIKEQNPGVDMLFAVNWDQHVMGSAFPTGPLPELTGIGGLEIVDIGGLEQTAESAEDQPAETTAQSTEDQGDGAPATDPSASPPEPESVGAADEQPSPTAEVTETSASTSPVVSTTGSFGWSLLLWILGGLAVVTSVVVAGSFWMWSRQQQT